MIVKYLFEDVEEKIVVGYDCKLPRAKEMARYTAKTYKGKLLGEEESGNVALIEDFSNEKENNKRQANRRI